MTGVRIMCKDGVFYVDSRVGSGHTFKPVAQEFSPRAALNRAGEILGLNFSESAELVSSRREADMLRDALSTVRYELGAAWPGITEEVMQRVETVCDVVGVRGDHRCSRCLMSVSSEGAHTCTPTPEWRELERHRDELAADNVLLREEIAAMKKDASRWRAIETLMILGDVELKQDGDGGYSIYVEPVENIVSQGWEGDTPEQVADAVVAKLGDEIETAPSLTPAESYAEVQRLRQQLAAAEKQISELQSEIQRKEAVIDGYDSSQRTAIENWNKCADMVRKAEKQRDELLAALERFMDSHEECTDFDGFAAQIVSMDDYHEAQEAIASVKGGAA